MLLQSKTIIGPNCFVINTSFVHPHVFLCQARNAKYLPSALTCHAQSTIKPLITHMSIVTSTGAQLCQFVKPTHVARGAMQPLSA